MGGSFSFYYYLEVDIEWLCNHMESNCKRKELFLKKDAEGEQKKRLKDIVTCTVKNAEGEGPGEGPCV